MRSPSGRSGGPTRCGFLRNRQVADAVAFRHSNDPLAGPSVLARGPTDNGGDIEPSNDPPVGSSVLARVIKRVHHVGAIHPVKKWGVLNLLRGCK